MSRGRAEAWPNHIRIPRLSIVIVELENGLICITLIDQNVPAQRCRSCVRQIKLASGVGHQLEANIVSYLRSDASNLNSLNEVTLGHSLNDGLVRAVKHKIGSLHENIKSCNVIFSVRELEKQSPIHRVRSGDLVCRVDDLNKVPPVISFNDLAVVNNNHLGAEHLHLKSVASGVGGLDGLHGGNSEWWFSLGGVLQIACLRVTFVFVRKS